MRDDGPARPRSARYLIFVDGQPASALGPGQPVDLTLTAGPHELRARSGWQLSPRVRVGVREGMLAFRVHRRRSPLGLSWLVHPRARLLLDQLPSPGTGAGRRLSRSAGV